MSSQLATTTDLPPLFAGGVEISSSPEKFGFLPESTAGASMKTCRERMREDGFLFLRDFWPRPQVQRVRDSFMAQLDRLGFLEKGAPRDEGHAIPGKDIGRAMGHPLDQKDPLLQQLVFGDRILNFFAEFLGGPVTHFDFIWFRTKTPGKGSPIHCDLVYMGRGTHDLYTAWIPFGDIDLSMGGLLVLEGSHRKNDKLKGYLERDVDTYCTNKADAAEYASGRKWWDGTLSKNAPGLQDSLGGRWLTAREFRMGDVLLFNMTLAHGSLDNRTDRIRISTDTRYQLSSEPVDDRWIGENPPGHTTAMRKGRVC